MRAPAPARRVPLQRPSLDVALWAAFGRSNSIPSNLSLLVQRQFCREQNWTRFSAPAGSAPGTVRIKVTKESTLPPIRPCQPVAPAQQSRCTGKRSRGVGVETSARPYGCKTCFSWLLLFVLRRSEHVQREVTQGAGAEPPARSGWVRPQAARSTQGQFQLAHSNFSRGFLRYLAATPGLRPRGFQMDWPRAAREFSWFAHSVA